MDLPRPEEMSDFKRHLQDIRESQEDLQRVFEKGKRGGLWNTRDLREYNRSMADYKRHLADVERAHKAVERVKGDEGANIRARQALGVKVGGDELRRYDKIVRHERQLLRMKESSTRELAKHESHYSKMEKAMHRGSRGGTGIYGGTIAATGGIGSSSRAVAKAIGASMMAAGGYGYHQLMQGADLFTQFEMARGATEKLGGQFASSYMTKGASWKDTIRLSRKAHEEMGKDPEGFLKKTLDWINNKSKESGSLEGLQNHWRAEHRRKVVEKYQKQIAPRRVAGELGKYESYGMQLGYSIPEAHQLAQGGLRALPGNRFRDMQSNLAMYRGYSIDPGSLSGYQSSARFGGYEGGAAQLNQQLIGAFTKGKFPRALMGEFLQALTQVSNTMAGSGGVVNQRSAAHTLAVYGSAMGQGYRNSPQRTAQLLQTLHQGIGAPGGGDSGKAFVMKALGLGSGKSYLQVREAMDRGATPGNIRKILAYGMENLGSDHTLLAMREMFGVKIPAGRKLLAAYGRGDLSDAAIQAQVGIGKDADLNSAKGLRLGFKTLELEKMAEKAKIAQKSVNAVRLAYELQTTAAYGTAAAIEAVTGTLDSLIKKASGILRSTR